MRLIRLPGRAQPWHKGGHRLVYTDAQILEARRLKREGWTYRAIAAHFDMAVSHVFRVINYTRRKDLP